MTTTDNGSFAKEVNDAAVKQFEVLHDRFVKGLREGYGMTDIDIARVENEWWWCGGRSQRTDEDGKVIEIIDEKTFRYTFPDVSIPFPDYDKECVCGQKLPINNAWITNKDEIIIIGICCKDMFILRRGKTCSRCKKAHRNRVGNDCNSCRIRAKVSVELDKIYQKKLIKIQNEFRYEKQEQQRLLKEANDRMIKEMVRKSKIQEEQIKAMQCPGCNGMKKIDFRFCWKCHQKRSTAFKYTKEPGEL